MSTIRNPNYQRPSGNTLLHSEVSDAARSEDHVEHLLDQALEATFPASDPIAVTPVSHTLR
jgi:hypothetical protein